MPIAREYRHLYRGPAWLEVRERTLELASNCCERCGKPNGAVVLATSSAWFDSITRRWIRAGLRTRDHRPPVERGVPCLRPCAPASLKLSQLGVAHINHRSGDNRRRNLAAWCRECHLLFDKPKHARTRAERKDRARPLLAAASADLNENGLDYYPRKEGDSARYRD